MNQLRLRVHLRVDCELECKNLSVLLHWKLVYDTSISVDYL